MQSDFLGLILVAQGAITREALFEGLRRQAQTGEMLGEALVKLDALTENHLERGLAVQIGAPIFEPEWLPAALPESPCRIPEDIDARLLYIAEGLEIWGIRTPAGRVWLESRTDDFDGEIGLYVLPDRAWKEATVGESVSADDVEPIPAKESLSTHEAIERLYEAPELESLVVTLGLGLHDMFAHVGAGLVRDGEIDVCWTVGQALQAADFERCESVEGWEVQEASTALKETRGNYGWRLSFGVEDRLVAVFYVFDDEVDDPIVFQELTREFETAHKLLMERVNSG